MLGYGFVGLSADEVDARRQALNRQGYTAYLSSIGVFVLVYGFRVLASAMTWRLLGSRRPPNTGLSLSRPILYWRRLAWALGSSPNIEFAPWSVQLSGLVYMGYLGYLTMHGTTPDYMHVTKAFGQVAASQLPLHYLLSIKSPYSPLTRATGLTHERLNAFHRFSGRMLHLWLAVHAALYLNFFVQKGLLGSRLTDNDVQLGLAAFWSITFMAALASPAVRKKAYHQVFYRSHVILSASLLVFVWSHVPYTRIYVGQAGLIWIINGLLRSTGNHTAQFTCTAINGGLIQVQGEVKHDSKRWPVTPGQHMYLCAQGLGPRCPFTVLDVKHAVDSVSAEITFVVRDLGGPMTGALGRAARHQHTMDLAVEGPYGESKEYMPRLLKQPDRSVLLVAGGVGATYTIPIVKALLFRGGRDSFIKFVWLVRSVDDSLWGMEELKACKANVDIDIYVTQPPSTGISTDLANAMVTSSGSYDLRRRSSHVVSGGVKTSTTSQLPTVPGLRLHQMGTRPNLEEIVDNFFHRSDELAAHHSTEGNQEVFGDGTDVVMVCGPWQLSQDLRKAVGTHVWKYGRPVEWYEEVFGFGSSA